MREGAISKDALLASLRDIRLPEAGSADLVSNLTATLALASVLALLLVGLFQLLSRPGQHQDATRETLSDAERRLALLRLLKDRAPERYAALRPRLYRPDGDLDAATLEAEVARHV